VKPGEGATKAGGRTAARVCVGLRVCARPRRSWANDRCAARREAKRSATDDEAIEPRRGKLCRGVRRRSGPFSRLLIAGFCAGDTISGCSFVDHEAERGCKHDAKGAAEAGRLEKVKCTSPLCCSLAAVTLCYIGTRGAVCYSFHCVESS